MKFREAEVAGGSKSEFVAKRADRNTVSARRPDNGRAALIPLASDHTKSQRT